MLHGFEWIFARMAPIILAGSIAGAVASRKLGPSSLSRSIYHGHRLAMGSTLNNDHTKKRFFVLFFRSAKYRSAVRHKSAGKMR